MPMFLTCSGAFSKICRGVRACAVVSGEHGRPCSRARWDPHAEGLARGVREPSEQSPAQPRERSRRAGRHTQRAVAASQQATPQRRAVVEGCGGGAHLVDRDDLAIGLLHTAQAADEVPEARAGNDLVLSEDLHAVDLALRVRLAILGVRHKPTNNLVQRLPGGQNRVPLPHIEPAHEGHECHESVQTDCPRPPAASVSPPDPPSYQPAQRGRRKRRTPRPSGHIRAVRPRARGKWDVRRPPAPIVQLLCRLLADGGAAKGERKAGSPVSVHRASCASTSKGVYNRP